MLQHLVDYARNHELVVEPGFAPKDVKWAITCDRNGKFTGLLPLGETKKGQSFPCCPNLSQSELIAGASARCHFLIETIDVVLGLGEEDKKRREKHDFFLFLLKEASQAVPELIAAVRLLENSENLKTIQKLLDDQGAKLTEKTTIFIGDFNPLDSDRWHGWWRTFRSELSGSSEGNTEAAPGKHRMVCLMSGESVTPCLSHPIISGLGSVGGLPTGDRLSAFDKQSFQSYELEQGANACMSEEMANRYVRAFGDLIRKHSQKHSQTLVLYWYKHSVAGVDDPLAWLSAMDDAEGQELSAQQRARELLQSIRTGKRSELAQNQYFSMTISGASGRVMVRDWMEGDFPELISHVESWFSDFSMVDRDGVRLCRNPKLMAIAAATVRDLKDLPATTSGALWRCALLALPIPYALFSQALGRLRCDIVSGESMNHARMGLIKAYFVRKKGGATMTAYLNQDHPEPAYQCGRLLAVLAHLQRTALGDVGAGVVQRYYIASSQTPALTLGRLIGNAKNHLQKLEPGLMRWHEQRIAAIMSQMGARVPRILDLEQQGLFALGYYQQLASDMPGATSSEITKETSNA
jgi:CRISPR-associated protein Csd1